MSVLTDPWSKPREMPDMKIENGRVVISMEEFDNTPKDTLKGLMAVAAMEAQWPVMGLSPVSVDDFKQALEADIFRGWYTTSVAQEPTEPPAPKYSAFIIGGTEYRFPRIEFPVLPWIRRRVLKFYMKLDDELSHSRWEAIRRLPDRIMGKFSLSYIGGCYIIYTLNSHNAALDAVIKKELGL